MHCFTVRDIIPFLSGSDQIIGDLSRSFSTLDDMNNVKASSLDWLNQSCSDTKAYIEKSLAKTIIVSHSNHAVIEGLNLDKTFVFTDNPILLFSRIARGLFRSEIDYTIDSHSLINPMSMISGRVFIGAFTIIGQAILSDGCVIMDHCTIGDNVEIGANVFIKSGSRIGNEGFGFVCNKLGELEKFPQVGCVKISDNVEIGANTCIDRGSLSTTEIGSGTKIDNLCQIAHNVIIGKNCFIAGNVSIGGSCKIGNNVQIGPSVTILQGLKIGDNAFISMGSIVTKNIKTGQRVIGYPAMDMGKFVIERNKIKHLIDE